MPRSGRCLPEEERFCAQEVPSTEGCFAGPGGDYAFFCNCIDGYFQIGSNKNSKCIEQKRCEVNNGGCDEHAKCVPRTGDQPLCPCLDGYRGGGYQGDVCEDIDECTESKTPPCGFPEQHLACTNTPGSYDCSCEKGYEGYGDYRECQPIDFCTDKKLNDCDLPFATCTLNEGSYVCKCKPGLHSYGTENLCRVARGFTSNVYCEILGHPCNEYQDCIISAEKTAREYECFYKSPKKQIGVFFASGPSLNTPGWVWAVVVIGCILLFGGVGYLARWAYKRAKGEDIDDEMMAAALYAQEDDYGATGPPG